MHTITFLLKTVPDTAMELEKRIQILWRMHNALVKHAQHRINRMRNSREYRDTLKEYQEIASSLKQKKLSASDRKSLSAKKEELSKKLSGIRVQNGLSQAELEKYIAVMQHRYRHLISSQQAQKEAVRVWHGVEKVLFGNGKHLRFKKLRDMYSISQKCATNGAKLDLKHSVLEWLGISIPVQINKADPYVKGSISYKFRYCEIKRRRFSSGDRWYVTAYFDGPAPDKIKPANGTFGIDPGTSTEAIVSSKGLELTELSPRCADYNRRIAREQCLIDTDMRRDNPENYNPDGSVKKGRHKWNISNGCKNRKIKLSVLQRKKAAYTRQFQFELAGRIIRNYGTNGIVETMDYQALQKRSRKAPERRINTSRIKKKDGSVLTVHKFKKKRRFGKSINDRAPAQFLQILEMKCRQYGGRLLSIDTRSFRASQYHHDTGAYIKPDLSDRWKTITGHRVQRDLYSAFLILHSNAAGTAPDQKQCIADFSRFITLHDAYILAHAGEDHPACFGF